MLLAALALVVAMAPYPGVTPQPATTDPAALHALARDREVAERIRIAFDAIGRSDWNGAAAELERVVALRPREPQGSTAYYDLGLAHAGLGAYDKAAADFGAAIARDDGFLAARANLVSVELSRGDLPAAKAAADALLALAPDSARGIYERGIVALRSGDSRTAASAFRTLTGRDPKYAVAHYDLALAEQNLGDLASAERELREALALAPAYARAAIALGAVLLHEGKKDEARSVFDDAVRTATDPSLKALATSLREAT